VTSWHKLLHLQFLLQNYPSATVVSAEPFSHGTGTLRACRREWRLTDTDLCPCGETQTMSHIVESCPLTKLNGGLSRLHSADEDAVSWLTNYGKWHVYEKKKKSNRATEADEPRRRLPDTTPAAVYTLYQNLNYPSILHSTPSPPTYDFIKQFCTFFCLNPLLQSARH